MPPIHAVTKISLEAPQGHVSPKPDIEQTRAAEASCRKLSQISLLRL
jgi:hypothetical protein